MTEIMLSSTDAAIIGAYASIGAAYLLIVWDWAKDQRRNKLAGKFALAHIQMEIHRNRGYIRDLKLEDVENHPVTIPLLDSAWKSRGEGWHYADRSPKLVVMIELYYERVAYVNRLLEFRAGWILNRWNSSNFDEVLRLLNSQLFTEYTWLSARSETIEKSFPPTTVHFIEDQDVYREFGLESGPRSPNS